MSAAQYGAALSVEDHLAVLQTLASGGVASGRTIQSFRYAQVGAKFAFEHQQQQACANLLRLATRVHWQSGNLPVVLRELRLVLQRASDHKINALAASAHLGISAVYIRLSEFSYAKLQGEIAFSIAEENGLFHIAAVARNNHAEIFLRSGDTENALREVERAIEFAEQSTKRALITAWDTQAQILFAMKNYDAALAIFARCRDALGIYSYVELSVGVEYQAARVLAKLGRDEEAVECLKRSAAQAREAGMSAAEARALLALSQWHARAANAKDALASI
ncbi:MAG: tetratricopeptide repeat protein, partial [Casimicrobium sp.]